MNYEYYRDMVLQENKQALGMVDGKSVSSLVDMICESEKVFVVGVGRVLLMLQAFVKRLNHLGIDANFVGAVNEPPITDRDLLIVGSASGESIVPLEIVKKAKSFNAKIAHIGSNKNSSMAKYENLFVRIPCRSKLMLEDEIDSRQLMSSLFEQSLLLLSDIVAMMIAEKKGIRDIKALWRRHANLE